MLRRSTGLAAALLLVPLTLSAALHAQPSASEQARAEALFRAGRDLMGEKKYAEACPKFAESQRLDPGPGTLVNLARCHQLEGKTATAWAEFNEFLALPRGDSKKWADWERAAREGLAEITPTLSRLVIEVPEPIARLKGLQVSRDESALASAEWGVAVPVDPGSHTVSARAEGKRPWSVSVVIGPQADRKVVKVPVLDDAPAAAPSASPPATTAAPPPPPTDTAPAATTSASIEPSGSRRTVGLIAGGVGVLGLGLGAYFGLQARSQWSDAKATCPERACASAAAVDQRNKAIRAANVANVGLGLGLIGVGVGVYLLLTPEKTEQARARVVPAVGRQGGGVAVVGRF